MLVTQDWMLLVPRSQEYFEGVSINALGFAGSLFVRNESERQILRDHGPWQVLAQVGLPL
jgi:ATP adenylyltransferase